MKYEIRKTAEGYVLIINREDGTRNDYRFKNKAELTWTGKGYILRSPPNSRASSRPRTRNRQ
jgi:hypothetical protein